MKAGLVYRLAPWMNLPIQRNQSGIQDIPCHAHVDPTGDGMHDRKQTLVAVSLGPPLLS